MPLVPTGFRKTIFLVHTSDTFFCCYAVGRFGRQPNCRPPVSHLTEHALADIIEPRF